LSSSPDKGSLGRCRAGAANRHCGFRQIKGRVKNPPLRLARSPSNGTSYQISCHPRGAPATWQSPGRMWRNRKPCHRSTAPDPPFVYGKPDMEAGDCHGHKCPRNDTEVGKPTATVRQSGLRCVGGRVKNPPLQGMCVVGEGLDPPTNGSKTTEPPVGVTVGEGFHPSLRPKGAPQKRSFATPRPTEPATINHVTREERQRRGNLLL